MTLVEDALVVRSVMRVPEATRQISPPSLSFVFPITRRLSPLSLRFKEVLRRRLSDTRRSPVRRSYIISRRGQRNNSCKDDRGTATTRLCRCIEPLPWHAAFETKVNALLFVGFSHDRRLVLFVLVLFVVFVLVVIVGIARRHGIGRGGEEAPFEPPRGTIVGKACG